MKHDAPVRLVGERIPLGGVSDLCRKWKVHSLWAFGSVLGEFRADSDVDLLVEFLPEADWGLVEHVEMQEELESLFGRPVDLVEKEALTNPYRRRAILSTCVPLYAA